MSDALFTFTEADAEFVLGRKLLPHEGKAIAKSLALALSPEAVYVVQDYSNDDLADHRCPRCAHLIPRDEFPGEYPGAISRVDNLTDICSLCGTDEAIGWGPVPRSEWPLEFPWHTKTVALDEGAVERIRESLARKEGTDAHETSDA